jgi:signal transduction histidine kinase
LLNSDSGDGTGASGVGLGLAVAGKIARSFGGHLTADSELGASSRFELRLPIAPVSDALRAFTAAATSS